MSEEFESDSDSEEDEESLEESESKSDDEELDDSLDSESLSELFDATGCQLRLFRETSRERVRLLGERETDGQYSPGV